MNLRRTLGIVGAGALIDGWRPVIEAMQAVGYAEVTSPNAANFALARIVYAVRQLEFYAPIVQEWVSRRDEFRAKLGRLRNAIADRLDEAQRSGRISPRAEFASVIRETIVDGSEEAGIVTTNWDFATEDAGHAVKDELPTYYLHGNTRRPGGLYLPTEIAEEPYRTEEEKGQLVGIRRDLVAAIRIASRIVIYGLSVSPLDAELGQLLASGLSGSTLEEVLIVNPEFREVGERVATLVEDDAPRVRILGCHPEQLRDVTMIPLSRSG